MKKKQINIYDISEKAGVSIATVSRVINDSEKVSAKTREKVLALIEEMDYAPNAYARGLGKGTMKTIGILCADVKDTYLASAVSFLERELRNNGFLTILNCTGYEYKDKVQSMKAMIERRVDAVILVGSQYIEPSDAKNKYIKDASQLMPVMLLNGYIKGDNIYCSLSDDYQAFYAATEKLIDEDRKSILYMFREHTASEKRKFNGYVDALKAHGIEFDEKHSMNINDNIRQIESAVEELFENSPGYDAILACDDELAMGALKCVLKKGMSIPEDISIIGCNNSFVSICSYPELTSIDNGCEILCVNIVSTLIRVLEGKNISRKSVIEPEMVLRATTL